MLSPLISQSLSKRANNSTRPFRGQHRKTISRPEELGLLSHRPQAIRSLKQYKFTHLTAQIAEKVCITWKTTWLAKRQILRKKKKRETRGYSQLLYLLWALRKTLRIATFLKTLYFLNPVQRVVGDKTICEAPYMAFKKLLFSYSLCTLWPVWVYSVERLLLTDKMEIFQGLLIW